MVDCNWINPYVLTTADPSDPTAWQSGIYLVKLTAGISGKQSYIIFVVRDDSCTSDVVFQSSVTTYQAYNAWGGKSLYSFNSTGSIPANLVSFDRPYDGGDGTGQYLRWELNMVGFLEREGFDVSYITNIDTHANAAGLLMHKVFLSVAHDEYWSWEMRCQTVPQSLSRRE
jgi:hypothetical protein